jgi:biopolymer transport protein ExbB/TolQ
MYLPPTLILTGSSLLYAWEKSDGFGKTVVVILFMMSIYAWTIMTDKSITMRRVRKHSGKFLSMFRESASPVELALQADHFIGPIPVVYRAAIEEVMDVLDVDPQLVETYCRRRSLPRALNAHEVDKVRSTMEREVASQVLELEDKLGWLATIVSISPFLGLLGTVWGVMIAFVGMAQVGRPDISAIAPGVSGALLTTVAGLFVAIPSVMGYNHIANSVQKTRVEMDNFVEDFISLLKLHKEE